MLRRAATTARKNEIRSRSGPPPSAPGAPEPRALRYWRGSGLCMRRQSQQIRTGHCHRGQCDTTDNYGGVVDGSDSDEPPPDVMATLTRSITAAHFRRQPRFLANRPRHEPEPRQQRRARGSCAPGADGGGPERERASCFARSVAARSRAADHCLCTRRCAGSPSRPLLVARDSFYDADF